MVKMNKVKQFLLSNIEDFLIFAGLILIIIATFILSFIAGIYVTGIILLILGCYFTKFPARKGR
jgi:membrane-bound ClpP family serine protease